MTASNPQHAPARRWAVRLIRAGLLVAILLALRFQAGVGPAADGQIELADVFPFFPTAFALRPGDDLTSVLAEDESKLGFAVRTLPESQNIIGYAGPADVLIALDEAGVVTGTELLWSGDTPEHIREVEESADFFDAFKGWSFSGDNDVTEIDSVSGATLTSLAIVGAVARRLGGDQPSLKFPDPVALEDVQRIFPEAATVDAQPENERRQPVRDAEGAILGTVVRTAPLSDSIMGYQGPSDGLLGLTPDGKVAGITLGATYESQRYADYVREDDYFTALHEGLTLEELADVETRRAWMDGVSGATMTSGALMEGVVARARALVAPEEKEPATAASMAFRLRDGITFIAIVFACLVAYTRLRANPYARYALYLYLVLALGLWAGDMVSLAVLGGWAKGAVPLQNAPGLVALVAAALLLPWTTGKPVYCQQLCPHGAAQALLYRIVPGRLRVPPKLHRILLAVPALVLAAGLAVAAYGMDLSLSALEPFDAWIFGVGGIATIAIAIVGLIAAMFIPQAYCKYGCPTGAILDYARTRRHETSLTRHDAVAAALLVLAIVLGGLSG